MGCCLSLESLLVPVLAVELCYKFFIIVLSLVTGRTAVCLWRGVAVQQWKRKGQQGSSCCTGEPLPYTLSGMLLWTAAETLFAATCKQNPVASAAVTPDGAGEEAPISSLLCFLSLLQRHLEFC